MPPMLRDIAPAKINLFLHVLGRRRDGYHLLESLVGFADIGDEIGYQPGRATALMIEGPFAAALADEDDNLILRAARAFAAAFPDAPSGRFDLAKHLPVASGIGGGSSDAAAALRLMAKAGGIALDDPALIAIARTLGADVPVCLDPRPRLMRGIGHDLGPVLDHALVPALLVNPGVAVETAAVFAALGLMPGDRFEYAGVAGDPGASGDAIARLAATTRNDLEEAAMRVQPIVAVVLEELRALPGCRLARMSGSGATCFALFDSLESSKAAREAIAAGQKGCGKEGWWSRACRIKVAS